MTESVHHFANQLREYATHFEMRDWNYTREHDIVTLRYTRFGSRVRDVAKYTSRHLARKLRRETDNLERITGIKGSLGGTIRSHWRYHNALPDGVLDDGAIITHWEETGEYLQYVQPSVGALLADLMDAHPDLPEVQAIANEMKRINDAYGARLNTEETE